MRRPHAAPAGADAGLTGNVSPAATALPGRNRTGPVPAGRARQPGTVTTLPYELSHIDGLSGPAEPVSAVPGRAELLLPGVEPAADAARILVVDDDRDLLDLVSVKLRLAGYHVLTAASGPDALRVARSGGPDAMVLDVGLPGLTGLDVCFRLRNDVATTRVPVLLLTARSKPSDVAMGFALGAKDYMVKPFNTRELVRRVRAMLPRDLR